MYSFVTTRTLHLDTLPAEANKTILMIEGGLQAKEILLKKIEQESLPTGTVELGQQSKPKPSK